MSLDGFLFEGRDQTAKAVAKGTVYPVAHVQSALEAGAKTMPELVALCERSVARAQRKGWKAGKKALETAIARGGW